MRRYSFIYSSRSGCLRVRLLLVVAIHPSVAHSLTIRLRAFCLALNLCSFSFPMGWTSHRPEIQSVFCA
eukprot:COSAG03_NODE_1473_length_4019_cov_1.826531_2_plen_69_part_00